MVKIGIPTILGLSLNYFCNFLSGPEMVSRFAGAEDEKTAVKASVLSAILMALLAFMPTIIGLVALAENPGLDGGKEITALMYPASKYIPTAITGFVATAVITATMSSALLKINLITLNLFTFALRTAGPISAYALGMVVPNATKNSGSLHCCRFCRCSRLANLQYERGETLLESYRLSSDVS